MPITETFHGFIETTTDTLLIFEACRQGILPKINRRLQERERGAVKSGTVFVFDEKESGIKRWTDGLVWSPSRILGNFLIYRELDGRELLDEKASNLSSMSNSRLYSDEYKTSDRERALVGSLTDTYKFKKGGLIKKTLSIQVNGSSQHLISYYTKEDVLNGKLATPSSIPEIASVQISPDLFMQQNFRIPLSLEYPEPFNKRLSISSNDSSAVSRRRSSVFYMESSYPYMDAYSGYYSRRRVSSGDLDPSSRKIHRSYYDNTNKDASTPSRTSSKSHATPFFNYKDSSPHMTTAASATIVSPTLSSFQCSSIYHPTHELNFTEGAQFTATTNTTTTTTSTTSPSNNTHTNTITTTNTNKNNTQSMTYSPHKEDNVYAPQLTPQSTSSWFQLPKYNLSPKLSDSTCYYNHHHSHNQHKKSPPKQTVHAESIPGPNIRNFISFKTIDSMPLESHHSQQAYFSSRAR